MYLGLTEAQFWEYTPRQVLLVWDLHVQSEERSDRRIALICTMICTAQGAKKMDGRQFTVEDFLPRSKPVEQQQSVESMIAFARAYTDSWTPRGNGHA